VIREGYEFTCAAIGIREDHEFTRVAIGIPEDHDFSNAAIGKPARARVYSRRKRLLNVAGFSR